MQRALSSAGFRHVRFADRAPGGTRGRYRVAAIAPENLIRITDVADPARFWEVSIGDKEVWCVRAHDGRIEGGGKHGVGGRVASGVLAEALGDS